MFKIRNPVPGESPGALRAREQPALSSVGIRTNEIMRVLTVISSIFIPLTFIAGVYGMNFAREVAGKKLPWNMPELYSPYGYIACLLFMLAMAIFQIVYFKRRRWM